MRHVLLAALSAVAFANWTVSLVSAAEQSPEQAIRSFYKWYVAALESGGDPLSKRPSELRRYVTERLLKQIEKVRTSADGLESDPFLDAQDFDKAWGSQITVKEPVIKGDKATCDVVLDGPQLGRKKLGLALVLDGGVWKVDKVTGRG